MQIRDCHTHDSNALIALWIEAWTPVLPQIDFVARQGFIRSRLLEFSTPTKRARLIEMNDQIAGFFLLDVPIGDLDQIAVAPTYWGKIIMSGTSVAETLLAEAKRLCPHGLTLSVNRDNPRALAFYRKQGFVITGEGISSASNLPILTMAWTQPPNCRDASRA